MGMNAIGSESLSQFRQHQHQLGPNGSSGVLDISEFPVLKGGTAMSSGITNGISSELASTCRSCNAHFV